MENSCYKAALLRVFCQLLRTTPKMRRIHADSSARYSPSLRFMISLLFLWSCGNIQRVTFAIAELPLPKAPAPALTSKNVYWLYQHGIYHEKQNFYAAPPSAPLREAMENPEIARPQCAHEVWKKLPRLLSKGYHRLSQQLEQERDEQVVGREGRTASSSGAGNVEERKNSWAKDDMAQQDEAHRDSQANLAASLRSRNAAEIASGVLGGSAADEPYYITREDPEASRVQPAVDIPGLFSETSRLPLFLLRSWYFRFRKTCWAGFLAFIFFLIELHHRLFVPVDDQDDIQKLIAKSLGLPGQHASDVTHAIRRTNGAAIIPSVFRLVASSVTRLQSPLGWIQAEIADYPLQLHFFKFPFGKIGLLLAKELIKWGKFRPGRIRDEQEEQQVRWNLTTFAYDQIHALEFKPQPRYTVSSLSSASADPVPDTEENRHNKSRMLQEDPKIAVLDPAHSDNAFSMLQFLFPDEQRAQEKRRRSSLKTLDSAKKRASTTTPPLIVDVGVFDGGDWAAAAIEAGFQTIGFEPVAENRRQFVEKTLRVYGTCNVKMHDGHEDSDLGYLTEEITSAQDVQAKEAQSAASSASVFPLQRDDRANYILNDVFRMEFMPAAVEFPAGYLEPQSAKPAPEHAVEQGQRQEDSGNRNQAKTYFYGYRWNKCPRRNFCEDLRRKFVNEFVGNEDLCDVGKKRNMHKHRYHLFAFAIGDEKTTVRIERRGDYTSLHEQDFLGSRAEGASFEDVQVETLDAFFTFSDVAASASHHEVFVSNHSVNEAGRRGAFSSSQAEYQNQIESDIDELRPRLQDVDEISLLKIDVEGYELSVLRGAETLLRKRRIKHIWLEFQPTSLLAAGTDPVSLLWFLHGFGFRCASRHLGQLLAQLEEVKYVKGSTETNTLFPLSRASASFTKYLAFWYDTSVNVTFEGPEHSFADDLLCTLENEEV
ncbi:unnamed protein product [Amoebophrya sp. A120]|nr:unnamed protein product [Amoebophrya sp. A120]|eukprot:GSA120T00006349001.1